TQTTRDQPLPARGCKSRRRLLLSLRIGRAIVAGSSGSVMGPSVGGAWGRAVKGGGAGRFHAVPIADNSQMVFQVTYSRRVLYQRNVSMVFHLPELSVSTRRVSTCGLSPPLGSPDDHTQLRSVPGGDRRPPAAQLYFPRRVERLRSDPKPVEVSLALEARGTKIGLVPSTSRILYPAGSKKGRSRG